MNISPTTNISAQPLKKALHKNPEVQYPGTVIFMHESIKQRFSLHNQIALCLKLIGTPQALK